IIHRSINRRLDALLKVGNQIPHIAAENLIAALPAKHHLPISAGKLRHHILWKRSRPGYRVIEMVNDLAYILPKVLWSDVHFVQIEVARFRQVASISAFIISLIDAEFAGEPKECRLVLIPGERSHDTRV